MVTPNQPKGIKPKAEIPEVTASSSMSGEGLSGTKLIVVNTAITLIVCSLFITGNYLIVNGVVESKLANFVPSGESVHGEEAGEEVEKEERGIILDLGEFILNLSDPAAKRYLKVNVAVELTKSSHDPDLGANQSGGGHGGGGGEDPLQIIEKEMQQYKPAMKDAIISVLSSKTTEEVSSLAGKDLAKEQIKEAIDPIFAGERTVMRVSFGAFIIQ